MVRLLNRPDSGTPLEGSIGVTRGVPASDGKSPRARGDSSIGGKHMFIGSTNDHSKPEHTGQDGAIVLASGGIDSTACIAFFLSRKINVSAVFVDYGQISAKRERSAVSRICSFYGVPVRGLNCKGLGPWSMGFIPGRNALLLLSGMIEFPSDSGLLAIGIHSGTNYVDCSRSFVRQMQRIFDLYTDGRIHISAPFLRWTKRQIWDYCIVRGVPTHLTYSCEMGRKQPCGMCPSCRDLEALRAIGA